MTLSGIAVKIFGQLVQLNAWPVPIVGQGSDGQPVALALNADGSINTTGAGVQRTPTISTVNSSGTVAAGARKLTFIFSGDFSGTVLGTAFAGGTDASLTIDAPAGDTLAAVGYTVASGSIRIIQI